MEQAISLNKKLAVSLSQFSLILAVMYFAPFLQNQLLTGTIVNASLLVAVMLLGLRGAAVLAFMPSVISLFTGLLSPAMAPMVPFIIMSNIILITMFSMLKEKNYWMGAISGAILKFAFLSLTSSFVIGLFVKPEVAAKIAVMMSWPQLVTALLGGIIAYGVYLKKRS